MAIEPIIDIPAQQLHIRVEDTIVLTPNGAEILSTAVPKEVDELPALLRPSGRAHRQGHESRPLLCYSMFLRTEGTV